MTWEPDKHLRYRKRGHGWPAVARAIVTDMAHLLPPREPRSAESFLSGIHYYREDGSLIVDTYEGRWRDERTGEGGTMFTLLVRLLASWGAARKWLHQNDFMHGLGPGPRREPGGHRRRRYKGRRRNAGAPGTDSFWTPVRGHRLEEAARPAPTPPVASQFELWPEETAEKVIQRNLEAAARHEAEGERRWAAEMAKLSPAERNHREAKRCKGRRRYESTVR